MGLLAVNLFRAEEEGQSRQPVSNQRIVIKIKISQADGGLGARKQFLTLSFVHEAISQKVTAQGPTFHI